MTTALLERPSAAPAVGRFATFSITGGLASEYVARGEMIPWEGIIAVEAIETGDFRAIAPDALTWRPLPLPVMAQLVNPDGGDGHDAAFLAGRMDYIERLADGSIWARGFIDPNMPDADVLIEALDKGLIRWVSVDLDRVFRVDVEGPDGVEREVMTSARIMGITVVPFPALAEAEIRFDVELMRALAASGGEPEGATARITSLVDPVETIVASAGESLLVAPPADWFARPTVTEFTPFTVTAQGQVFGHICRWGTCHISFSNRCEPVPRSATNYAKFRTGTVLTAEGSTVRTGPLIMDTVHPDLRWRASNAQAFYADTGCAVADVVPYEDQFGIYLAGALRPGLTPEQLRTIRGSDWSPDWRSVDGYKREMVAILAVNNSGFKAIDSLVASAGVYVEPGNVAFARDHLDDVYALVASGPLREACCEACAARAAHVEDGNHDTAMAASAAALEAVSSPLDAEPAESSSDGDAAADSAADAELDAPETDAETAAQLASLIARFGPRPPRTFRAAARPVVRSFRSASR